MKRWTTAAALLAVATVFVVVSDHVSPGPRGLSLVAVGALLVPLALARIRGRHDVARGVTLAATAVVTALVVGSAVLLVGGLPGGRTPAPSLLRDAVLIWMANVGVFAVWYWEIDGGGPSRRHHDGYRSVDFVFPQRAAGSANDPNWTPSFVDYLFLAFNTSTAFSPTDTPVLSVRCKVLTMAQSSIALTVLAVLAARAVNTL